MEWGVRSVNVKKTKSSKKIVLKITMSMTLASTPGDAMEEESESTVGSSDN